jgi:hypothetical protein
MARKPNRPVSKQISDLEAAIKELQAKQEIESLANFLSSAEAEELNFLLGVESKLNKLFIDYGIKVNQIPVKKGIDSIRSSAQKLKDAENERELEA